MNIVISKDIVKIYEGCVLVRLMSGYKCEKEILFS